MTNVALRAARGETQITMYVLARGVTEPLLLLLAGLVLSSRCNGSVALPATLIVSVAGGAVVGATTLVRAFSARLLLYILMRPREWPVRELVRSSYPLGLADLLLSAQAKIDLVAVALATFSARQITAYAIAAELAAVFTAIRIGFDQIVVAVAAESRGHRDHLVQVVTTAMRWSLYVGVPIAIVMLLAPGRLLEMFGGADAAARILMILMIGRAVEMILGPAASVFAVIGRPELSLLDAAAGISVAMCLDITGCILGFGSLAIAVASSTGVIVSSVLPLYWLKLENIAPQWSAFGARRRTRYKAATATAPITGASGWMPR
jgi:hypothetical protein